jgi:uncharacterized protein YacL
MWMKIAKMIARALGVILVILSAVVITGLHGEYGNAIFHWTLFVPIALLLGAVSLLFHLTRNPKPRMR